MNFSESHGYRARTETAARCGGDGFMSDTVINMLNPTPSLLCKLGSIAIHAKELLSPEGHEFDYAAIRTLLGDAEVVTWLTQMDGAAMVPKMRQDNEKARAVIAKATGEQA